MVGGHFSKWRLVHCDPLDIALSVLNRYFYKVETLMGYTIESTIYVVFMVIHSTSPGDKGPDLA